MSEQELIKKALDAMTASYSPYSSFKVGAALLCKNGKVYTGTNIENSSFSATICAERSAFASAVSNGDTEFLKLAVVGGRMGEITDFCNPCGICRQVMTEFCDKDFKIIATNGNEIRINTLEELMPFGFGRENLC